jgi:hypothetical protein
MKSNQQSSLFQTQCPLGVVGCNRSHGNPAKAKPRKRLLRSGDELAVLGAESVSRDSDPRAISAIDFAIVSVARKGGSFTAEDVREEMMLNCLKHFTDIPEFHPNLLGARFLLLGKQGVIEPCGYVKAERTARRGGILRVWRKKL